MVRDVDLRAVLDPVQVFTHLILALLKITFYGMRKSVGLVNSRYSNIIEVDAYV